MKRIYLWVIIICSLITFIFIFPTYQNPSRGEIKKLKSIEVSENMNEIISDYILKYNKPLYAPSYVQFESHEIYGAEEKEDGIYVYMDVLYKGYDITESGLNNVSGGFIPTVIILVKNKDEDYYVKSYKEPQDGDEMMSSIKSMFPKNIANKLQNDVVRNKLQRDINIEAYKWLKANGKKNLKVLN